MFKTAALPSTELILAFATEARRSFHAALLEAGLLKTDANGVPTIADRSSRKIAASLLVRLKADAAGARLKGQIAGHKFEQIVTTYLETMLGQLGHLRPGEFEVRRNVPIDKFAQYEHLDAVEKALKKDPKLKAAMGRDYVFKQDVVVSRAPETDETINEHRVIVDDTVASRTSLRRTNNRHPLLHASISCKWTLRSDRAQGARTEALNLIRNRKGPLPRLMVVVGEPSPTRICSLALGTGDLDCVYHAALDELMEAVEESGSTKQKAALATLVQGGRLRDISDLPFDIIA